ncbi:MAG: N-acetylneuraminate synthase family protein, partial [Candidatus Omnitrophota bacterium]
SISDTTNGDLKYALEFGLKDFDTIDRYCREKGVLWYASAWDGISAHFINGFNVPCHKIASACLTHTDLLKRVRSNGKPVILSTGGSSIEQILRAVEILGREDLIILHCVANYPPSDEELNMSVIHTLKRMFPGVPIGYSGHEFDNLASLVAASMGACMIERHITLDRNLPGSDHKASIEPHEMEDLVQQIRRIEKAVGDGLKRVLSSEVPVMRKLRRVKDF